MGASVNQPATLVVVNSEGPQLSDRRVFRNVQGVGPPAIERLVVAVFRTLKIDLPGADHSEKSRKAAAARAHTTDTTTPRRCQPLRLRIKPSR